MTDNVRKYLLYAVGEILLVVIGILIALQVNNWNNERLERKQEIDILAEISQDLESSIYSLEVDIELNQSIISSIDTIMESLFADEAYNDSLDTHFGQLVFSTTITMNTSGYDNLKNTGFQIIQDDSLRKAITEFYETQHFFIQRYEASDQHTTMEYFTPRYLPYISQIDDIDRDLFLAPYRPGSFEELKTDREFHRLLDYLKFSKQELILNIELTLDYMKSLKIQIEQHSLTKA